MYATAVQLGRIAAEGLRARFARHRRMAERCHAFVADLRDRRGLDVQVLAPAGARSPTVTCIRLPDGVDGPEVVRRIREAGWVVGAGYGKLKATTFRIGHMGDHRPEGLEELLPVVEDALVRTRPA
jgi:aspartate aminotransferase-like enzyme